MGGDPLRLEMVLTSRYLSGGAALVLVGAVGLLWHAQPDDAPIKQLAAWQRLASPGDLSAAHSRLGGDCGACHTTVKGASPTKCIACHATEERLLIWPELTFHASVHDCRAGSILEDRDEIPTVIRLGLPQELRRSLACTNIAENALGPKNERLRLNLTHQLPTSSRGARS